VREKILCKWGLRLTLDKSGEDAFTYKPCEA
jgi:hypothetical protein